MTKSLTLKTKTTNKKTKEEEIKKEEETEKNIKRDSKNNNTYITDYHPTSHCQNDTQHTHRKKHGTTQHNTKIHTNDCSTINSKRPSNISQWHNDSNITIRDLRQQ